MLDGTAVYCVRVRNEHEKYNNATENQDLGTTRGNTWKEEGGVIFWGHSCAPPHGARASTEEQNQCSSRQGAEESSATVISP